MSRAEIGLLFEIVLAKKRQGHFHGVWASVPHLVELMASGQIALAGMLSPAVSKLKGMGQTH
ncbi:MAG: hypothetical protein Q7T85_09760 [Nitrosomonas sp.]|nr:hypothetical protein [Nitrosomonas sp.]